MSRVLTARTKGGGVMSDIIHFILEYNDFRNTSVSLVRKGKAGLDRPKGP